MTFRIYYRLKPFIPASVRIAARRWRAERRRVLHAQTWPIDPRAGNPPAGWPGWPGGKQFAVVLTHDVEGPVGQDRCRRLAEYEGDLGFRSSFNLVPEGSYRVSSQLRQELTSRGFEVGVHDLRHDGHLFESRESFQKQAARINHYLQEWDAVGFRAGFMFHNLEWIHDLKVLYDASTFDTDPFEPQPEGIGSIFPVWIPRRGGRGYVELPYTLVQDFTLFIVLREQTIELWKRKIDWIAERGGMVLIDTHPDYMSWEDRGRGRTEFPVSWYGEVLRYLATEYTGQYWHALPREVAQHTIEHRNLLNSPLGLRGKSQAMVADREAPSTATTV